ncbi:MAG TPA: hypothetical protein VFW19_02790 [Allosphingosinicella sp.]|nr:hypothetical protein [Allosphingosinicella sp.]
MQSQPLPIVAALWLSPDGDDSGPGTRDAPFRTLGRAHAELCRLAETAPPGSAIRIVLEDGTYFLDQPMRFDAGRFGPDGPRVRFVAAGDARPVVSGGRRIGGWTLHDAERNIWRASAQGVRSRQLYVNGRRATRAATIMADGGIPAGFRPSPVLPDPLSEIEPYRIEGGIDFLPTDLNPAAWRDPAQWRRPAEVEAVIETQWKMMRVPVRHVTPSDGTSPGTIRVAQPAWTNANLYFSQSKGDPPGGKPGIWSFWQVTRFENDYCFLDQPGEWVLDGEEDTLFYIPRAGEHMDAAEAILPALEVLVEAIGVDGRPVSGLSFEGIGFRHATWRGPSGDDGYVADQSGFCVRGDGHHPNLTGHEQHVARTPGNLRFAYARDIAFRDCRFEQLGAVALDFDTGSQSNSIRRCTFDDISSAAIQIGGNDQRDFDPTPAGHTRDNVITDNRISRTGRDYVDSAALYLGFTTNSLVANNEISEAPWAGIALGWGWGLLDPGSFPGISNAVSGMWGIHNRPTVNHRNRILNNRISRFLEKLWDGGAIYCCGWQGNGADDALRIEGNVAFAKRPSGGGNVLYTDGGSRHIIVRGNALFDNPIGAVWLGSPPRAGDPLPYDAGPSKLNGVPYGGDIGGCRTYGDISYQGNYWAAGIAPLEEAMIDFAEAAISKILTGTSFYTYFPEGFFDVCPYSSGGISYPTGLVYEDNHKLPLGRSDVPEAILRSAGPRDDGSESVASGSAPWGGGASFPPIDPGPSWTVPRVSLPGLFGMQRCYGQEWYYYVGILAAEDGPLFGLQLEIARFDAGIQIGLGLTGIGWRDESGQSLYLSGEGIGFGASTSRWMPAAEVVPPVSDRAFSARFRPLIEVVGRSPELKRGIKWNLPLLGPSRGWRFDYDARASRGARLGMPGSRYALSAEGRGLIAAADTAATRPARYGMALDLVDDRGTVMEGHSGYVGSGMFADGGVGLDSYECAQPVLRVSGGTLTIDGAERRIAGGTLWLDRQLIARAAPGSASGDQAAARRRGALRAALRGELPGAQPLYVGDWIGLTLDDGRSLALAEFWQKSTPQWITGTGVGKPPRHGFGNLYFPRDLDAPQANGGLALKARTAEVSDDWDFDLNLLDPRDPGASPHWTSPASNKTYATAWRIDFAPRAQRAGLPPTLYLRALSDNCEIIPSTADAAFFEGAALVYADRDFRRRLGQAFVEQMGFN